MLPLVYNTILIVTPITQLMKTHVTALLARPGPPLSIRLLHAILVGGHFPPKINDDLCLAFNINPSSMGGRKLSISTDRGCRGGWGWSQHPLFIFKWFLIFLCQSITSWWSQRGFVGLVIRFIVLLCRSGMITTEPARKVLHFLIYFFSFDILWESANYL